LRRKGGDISLARAPSGSILAQAILARAATAQRDGFEGKYLYSKVPSGPATIA